MPHSKDYHLTKNAKPAIRAYLGGSFDPVHNGHLQMALYVYQSLLPIAEQQQRELQVSLLPNARSPFKADSTDPKHRLAMLKLAIQGTPLYIDELEIWQPPPVYTIDSVRTLRQRYPADSLIFIMGMDSARSLDKWQDGLTLTDHVNLWVFNRLSIAENDPIINNNDENTIAQEKLINQDLVTSNLTALQSQLPIALQHFITDSATDLVAPALKSLTASSNLKNAAQGRIYIDPRPVAAISSTQVRQQLRKQGSQNATLQPINAIINPTVPNSFAKWLNPAVYQYIIDHQLYSAAQFR